MRAVAQHLHGNDARRGRERQATARKMSPTVANGVFNFSSVDMLCVDFCESFCSRPRAEREFYATCAARHALDQAPPMSSSRMPGLDVIIARSAPPRRFRRRLASSASMCSHALQVDAVTQRFRCRILHAVRSTRSLGQKWVVSHHGVFAAASTAVHLD